MVNHDKWTVESAQKADEQGKLREWLIEYLKNEGDNLKLAEAIEELTKTMTLEPLKMMSLDKMKIMVGPPESKRKWTDKNWETNTQKFIKLIQDGWSPPPIILTDYWGEKHAITDGNHRYEAMRQLGYKEYWAIQLVNKK